MHRLWSLLAIALSLCLFGCPSDPKHENFDYLRSPSDFKIDSVESNHPFCAELQSEFQNTEACQNQKKFRLQWERPEDTVDFIGYYIFLDTTPKGKSWKATQEHPEELANALQFDTLNRDQNNRVQSLIFFFGNKPSTLINLKEENHRIIALDSSGKLDNDTLVFAIIPKYKSGKIPGQPRYTYIITSDKFKPSPFNPLIETKAHTIELFWQRPNDPTSFFNPKADSGIITQYTIKIEKKINANANVFQGLENVMLSYVIGGSGHSTPKDSIVRNLATGKVTAKLFFLTDSGYAHANLKSSNADSIHATLDGLIAQDTVSILIFATDASGNNNEITSQKNTVILTDTTQPSKPLLQKSDSLVKRNELIISWKASRDSIRDSLSGKILEGPTPNFKIAEYHLTLKTKDDLIEQVLFTEKHTKNEIWSDTLKFLPPGTQYAVYLYSTDSTGYESQIDSQIVATPKIIFQGADSTVECPNGFVPIVGGRFTLGSNTGDADERPEKNVYIKPYCIEKNEHRDSGKFITNITYEDAVKSCKELSTADMQVQLCTEAQWERACEGSAQDTLLHGIQSEGSNHAILQKSCNQAANDPDMAADSTKRNKVCLTSEGVYDLAGNYSEWVLDDYGKENYTKTPDSINAMPLSALPLSMDTVHQYRGGNYYLPTIGITQIQNLARCSNRIPALQIRPVASAECISDHPKIVIIYDSLAGQHVCRDIPETLSKRGIIEFRPHRDSSKVLVFFANNTYDSMSINLNKQSAESLYVKRRPIAARLTTASLMEVTFVNDSRSIIDTLDATEIKDTTSTSEFQKVFQREAALPWKGETDANGKYKVKFIYAYAKLKSKVAKPYYSSRVVGLRCCGILPPQK